MIMKIRKGAWGGEHAKNVFCKDNEMERDGWGVGLQGKNMFYLDNRKGRGGGGGGGGVEEQGKNLLYI